MKNLWTFLFFLLILLMAPFRADANAAELSRFQLELAPESVTENNRAALKQFLSDVEARLPDQLKAFINRKITIRFTRLDSTTDFKVPPCNGDVQQTEEASNNPVLQTRGRVEIPWYGAEARISVILLNSVMIPEILKGPERSKTYSCGHRNLYRLALATLLHEVSHLYDFTDHMTTERGYQLQKCMTDPETRESAAQCEMNFSQHPRLVSGTPSFKNMMNWDPYTNRNTLRARSQDPYEFSKPEESFAVNMEYFLLDSEYACRRPLEFRYLRDHFSFDPFPARKCALNSRLEMTSNKMGSTGAAFDLDPARVYQVHYLYASKGPQMMSRFGHSMLRIILCSPKRKEVGPDCLNDIQYHVVVTFRANQGDWTVDSWKGLTGQYPSQMFLYPFYPTIVNEYTLDEPRNLISLPLKLSQEEKARLIERVIETYWTYQGRYYFVTNNCATETLHLLKAVYRGFDFQELNILTPNGLYQELSRLGLIYTSLVADEKKAMKSGYYFPTTNYVFEQAFKKIRDADPALVTFKSLAEFNNDSSPQERMQLYLSLKSAAGGSPKGLANYFFILESYILRLEQTDFMVQLTHLLEEPGSEMSAKLRRAMELQQLASPLSSSATGYGVPSLDDLEKASQISNDPAQSAEALKLYQEVMSWAKDQLRDSAEYIEATIKNRDFFLKEMRQRN